MTKQQMKKDFDGICKWKLLVPFVYICSWTLMIMGPLMFPYAYQIYCFAIIGYSVIKTLGIIFSIIYAIIKLNTTLKSCKKTENDKIHHPFNIYHAIIIPSYKEEEELLLQTLEVLAKNDNAKTSFIIMLAMQNHQDGATIKASSIIQQVRQKFLKIDFILHSMREGEAKGKASNVSWCVQFMAQKLETLSISEEQIMLTIIDADSWAPEEYFKELERLIYEKESQKHQTMFCPPQIFTRNHLQVPIFNRTYDNLHSMVHISSMVALKYCFPLSNYSISLSLAKNIGYWDTCSDAIGEDFHTCQKCYWKSEGPFYTVPIYIPFNQLSLETGKGYFRNIKARFGQALRHTRGVSDAAYCLNMLFKTHFRFRNLVLTLLVLQVYLVAAIVPWALFSIGIMYKIVQDPDIRFFPMWIIDVILNGTGGITLIGFLLYECFKRLANTKVYHQKNQPLWHLIFFPFAMIIALFGFSLPSFIIASFTSICTAPDYKVAQKKEITPKKTPTQSIDNQLVKTQPEQMCSPKQFIDRNNSIQAPSSDNLIKMGGSKQSDKTQSLDKKTTIPSKTIKK